MKGFTIAGHVDQVINAEGEKVQLGGPPCFSSALGKTLGFPVEVATEIGYDFPDELVPMLRSLGIDCEKRSDLPMTRFVLDYRYEPRMMMVPTICGPIKLSQIQNSERLLLCPIAGEVSNELIMDVDPSFLALDPQGLLRNIKEDYTVEPCEWCNPNALEKIDLLKTSSNEHSLITGITDIRKSLKKLVKLGIDVAVITDGRNGSYVMTHSDFFRVPVYPVEVMDSTGAGDVFIAGLASHIDEGLEWASTVASASSSAIVETSGPEIKCDKTEILGRAELIYEKIEQLC